MLEKIKLNTTVEGNAFNLTMEDGMLERDFVTINGVVYCSLFKYDGKVCIILKLDHVKLSWIYVCDFTSYYRVSVFFHQSTLFIVSPEENYLSARLLYLDESRRILKDTNIKLPFETSDYVIVPAHILV